ncbi:HipA domain-containing protein [Ideonella dechloratans]|uniref:HipA domain-containing protein n=1 Tax=Ideonella dechloratans TaxID=36863 RepID=UPI001E4A6498|nr:HipA domain-containing protein [Ideonella dechloratans]UFU10592.1 HipA domain-containing protein [Ideonella dechloratans]
MGRILAKAPCCRTTSQQGSGQAYVALAAAAARGEHQDPLLGGEQPKFTAYVECPEGPTLVLGKFTAPTDSEASQRWQDLLLAEHLALGLLREHGLPAAHSTIINHGGQRFLEVRRFDREGARGRRCLVSIGTLDTEFVGSGGSWPQMTRALVAAGIVQQEVIPAVDLLWVFGTLIGNTDMHRGTRSFPT